MYTIGELAEFSNVSVRTLRYYDEIGLLPPYERNAQGHRLYSDEDVSKLHYILTLRNLGFSLETIQDAMHDQQLTTRELLEMRVELIRNEQKELQRMENSIQSLLTLSEIERTTDWSTVFNTFYSSPKGEENLKKIWNMHFSKEEQTLLKAFPKLGEDSELGRNVIALFREVRANLHVCPTSEVAQQLAERWISLVGEMYKGNLELANKVWELNKKREVTGLLQFDEAMTTFIEQAIAHYNASLQGELQS